MRWNGARIFCFWRLPMSAYVVLILAVLSRCLPHWMHSSGIGATATGAGLLFFGAKMRGSRWQALAAVAVMACVDCYLTVFAYGFPFKASSYVLTWAWGAAVVLFANTVLRERQTFLRVAGSALFSATGFFLLSNAAVWWKSGMYPQSFAGLMESYAAGVPFYRNDAICTLLVCGALFGLPVMVRSMVDGETAAARTR